MTRLRQLNREYVREAKTIEQVHALLELDDREFWRRISLSNFHDPQFPSQEAAVYFVRHFVNSDDVTSAWRVIELLVKRSVRTITNRFRATVHSMETAEELADELYSKLYLEWLSLEARFEFWEIRFGFCLDKTILDVIRKYRRKRDIESGMPQPTEDFSEADRWAAIPDKSATNPLEKSTLRSALANLSQKESEVIFLYRIENWDEERIAEHMKVTSRTIRNYLRRAENRLRALLSGEE